MGLPRRTKKKKGRDIAFIAVTCLVMVLALVLGALLLGNVKINISHPASSPQPQYTSRIRNLTGEYLYNYTTRKLVSNITIDRLFNVTINLSNSSLAVGKRFYANATYNGIFNFMVYNATAYVNDVIDIKYIGFYENGSDNMLVYNNRRNVSNYFNQVSTPEDYTPRNANLFNYTAISFNLTPTTNASGHEWFFCGGEFFAYKNNSNWGTIFNNLTFERKTVDNSSIINMISGKCASAYVR